MSTLVEMKIRSLNITLIMCLLQLFGKKLLVFDAPSVADLQEVPLYPRYRLKMSTLVHTRFKIGPA